MGEVWAKRGQDVGRVVGQTVTDSLALLLLLVPVGIVVEISAHCLGLWVPQPLIDCRMRSEWAEWVTSKAAGER